jgi:hypothetical protein
MTLIGIEADNKAMNIVIAEINSALYYLNINLL